MLVRARRSPTTPVACSIDLTLAWGGSAAEPGTNGEARPSVGFRAPEARRSRRFLDGETFELAGTGLRDHSWGPRTWQAIWWYRWLTGNLGPDLGFALTVTGDREGGLRSHGFLYDTARYDDDRLVPIRGVELSTDYDAERFHRSLRASVRTDDHTYEIDGTVRSNVPLRNRRAAPSGEMQTTRITEGMTTWRTTGSSARARASTSTRSSRACRWESSPATDDGLRRRRRRRSAAPGSR
jgi:hypothetical protein